jgi:hypothetical protein
MIELSKNNMILVKPQDHIYYFLKIRYGRMGEIKLTERLNSQENILLKTEVLKSTRGLSL